MIATALLVLFLQIPPEAPPAQPDVDPALRGAVERFFATQVAEDVEGYLALWSASAQRPPAHQLQFIFDSGDDQFSDLTIERAAIMGATARVRLRVTRVRTDSRSKRADGSPMVFTSRLSWTLTFVRESDEWKLLREGTPIDELALALLAARTEDERKTLVEAEPDLLGERLLEAMSRRGDAEAQKGGYPAALQIYSRVLEIARAMRNRKGEGQALQNLGSAHYFLQQFPRALEMFERRLALEREEANDEGVANALSGVGSVRYALFEYGSSLAAYREAIAILEEIDDRMGLAAALVSTGSVLYLQGDLDGAIGDYRRSYDLYRAVSFKIGEARALEGLGLCYGAQGDLAAALWAYGLVLDEGRARNDARGQATALFHIGEIHLRLGNLDAARAQFDESLAFYDRMKDLANAGRSWQGVALTDLIAARYAAAERGYVKAQEACTAADDRPCVARATVGLAFAQSSQEQYEKAVVIYGRAIASFAQLASAAQSAADRRAFREEGARAELGLARALDGQKQHSAALAAAGRAHEQALELGSSDVLWRALVGEARALRRLGEREAAMTVASDATATIERMRALTRERPDARVAADSVEAFALRAILQSEAGDARGAWTTVEERRALALRLALVTNERDIHRGMTPEERAGERALAGELVALYLQRDREKALPKPDAGRLTKLEASLRDASARRDTQQRLLFERLPDLRRWRALEPTPLFDTLGSIVTGVGPVVAVQLVVDEDDLVVLTATSSESGPLLASHVSPVSRQKLAERVAALGDAATMRDEAAWRKAAAVIASAMPPTVLKLLAASRAVVVIPDDVLWRVPFEALPIDDRYLADVATVSYAGSVAALAAANRAPNRGAATPMLAVGAPDLGAWMRERLEETAPTWLLRAPEGAVREVTSVAAAYGESTPVLRLAAEATEDAWRAAAASAALVHVAAPFRINGASPLFSPVLLTTPAAEPREPEADGVLEAREIANLELPARAAIFTDGMTMSMRNAGAATPTVQWAWLAAGVPALILPRWVSDEAASDAIVVELHARLKGGDAPVDALHASRAKVRANPATSAPYYWAGWMVVGR
jgi:tetratricopeptide (TPR) repeat protein/CHAT domain-containing protein